jgi:hypothetical protein
MRAGSLIRERQEHARQGDPSEALCAPHAIEATGESPLKVAPPMGDIYARYATRELQEELSEGMVSKHKQMPQISFSDEDVAAILVYLYDLARSK